MQNAMRYNISFFIPLASVLFPFTYLTRGDFDLTAEFEGRPTVAPLGDEGGAKVAGSEGGRQGERSSRERWDKQEKRKKGSKKRRRELEFQDILIVIIFL